MYKLFIWDRISGQFITNKTLYPTKREAKKVIKDITDIKEHITFNYPKHITDEPLYYKLEKI